MVWKGLKFRASIHLEWENEEKIETLYVIKSSFKPRCPYPNIPFPIQPPPHPSHTTLPWAHLRGYWNYIITPSSFICIVKKNILYNVFNEDFSLSEILKIYHKRIPFIIYAGSLQVWVGYYCCDRAFAFNRKRNNNFLYKKRYIDNFFETTIVRLGTLSMIQTKQLYCLHRMKKFFFLKYLY